MKKLNINKQECIVGGAASASWRNPSNIAKLITAFTDSAIALTTTITSEIIGFKHINNSVEGSVKSHDISFSWDDSAALKSISSNMIGF